MFSGIVCQPFVISITDADHPSIRYTANRQPGKALPFFLRLRRPNVFDLIRENNLFTDVQDQALLLVEFDHELMEKRKKDGSEVVEGHSDAITLLVDHIHSIPVSSPTIFSLGAY
jgi:vacuolar protein sorting-associated protein 41